MRTSRENAGTPRTSVASTRFTLGELLAVMSIIALLGPCVCRCAGADQQSAAKANAVSPMTPLQKERARLRQGMLWAQRAKPSQKDMMKAMYDPIIKGNQEDADRNAKLAARFAEKVDEAEKNWQEAQLGIRLARGRWPAGYRQTLGWFQRT